MDGCIELHSLHIYFNICGTHFILLKIIQFFFKSAFRWFTCQCLILPYIMHFEHPLLLKSAESYRGWQSFTKSFQASEMMYLEVGLTDANSGGS